MTSADSTKHLVDQEKSEAKNQIQDCFSCRLIGSTALIIASGYVFFRGARAKLWHTKVTSAVFGTSLGYTGIARFLGLYPFDEQTKVYPKNANTS